MTSRDFAYWLQGFFEISNVDTKNAPVSLTAVQTEMIQRHLNMVFYHEIDPSFSKDQKKQEALTMLHNQKPGEPLVRC